MPSWPTRGLCSRREATVRGAIMHAATGAGREPLSSRLLLTPATDALHTHAMRLSLNATYTTSRNCGSRRGWSNVSTGAWRTGVVGLAG